MRGTIAQKILAKAAHRTDVEAGEFVVADVSLVFAHDGTSHLIFQAMKELGLNRPVDPSRFVMCIDHSAPSATPAMSDIHSEMRRNAKEKGFRLFDVGSGICHQLIPSEGYVRPGTVIVGADSHSVTHGAFNAFAIGVGSLDAAIALLDGKIWLMVPETVSIEIEGSLRSGVMSKDLILSIIGCVKADGMTYKAVEYSGEPIDKMSVDSRMTVTNMGTEMGAKASIMTLNDNTVAWLRSRIGDGFEQVMPDEDAQYSDHLTFNASTIEPVLAVPPDVDNVKSVSEVEGVEVDQVLIGSCTNGRMEDLEMASKILRGRRTKARTIVIPASKDIYTNALKNGIIESLLNSGCVIAPPTCGPCVGAHMGLLGKGEVAVSTSNRNFSGRMGDKDSRIYLASPATAAASAIEGKIADPRDFLR